MRVYGLPRFLQQVDLQCNAVLTFWTMDNQNSTGLGVALLSAQPPVRPEAQVTPEVLHAGSAIGEQLLSAEWRAGG